MKFAVEPDAGLSERSVDRVKPADPALTTLNVKVAMVPLPVKLAVDAPTDVVTSS